MHTGAGGYNRPCAHQYVGKYQSCMVENDRLIPHASYIPGFDIIAWDKVLIGSMLEQQMHGSKVCAALACVCSPEMDERTQGEGAE